MPLADTLPQPLMDDESHDAAFTGAKGHEALAPRPPGGEQAKQNAPYLAAAAVAVTGL